MAKALFRYLRGELNGFYLQSIHNAMNSSSEDIRAFLSKFSAMQFEENKIDDEVVYGIGRFAGVNLPRLSSSEGSGAFRLTESKENPNGEEISERGLFSQEEESFNFVHQLEDFQSTNDINTESNVNNKSTLIGSETLRGYIPSSATNVIKETGNIDTSKVTSTAPTDEAYSDFYGNNFLFVSEPFKTTTNIDVSLFLPLFKVMQYVRYNGANIVSLCKIIEILCPGGFVKIKSIEKNETLPYFTVNYYYDSSVVIDNRLQRIATLLYVVNLKFPQFVMVEGEK